MQQNNRTWSTGHKHNLFHTDIEENVLESLEFPQWDDRVVLLRQSHNISAPLPGAQWGSEPKGYLVVTNFWPTLSGSTTASLSLNNTTMPRSDKKETALVVRFIWRERKSLCKLFMHFQTKTGTLFPCTSDSRRKLKAENGFNLWHKLLSPLNSR